MLIPALIFVLSLAATMQFTIYSWRARLLRFAASSAVEDSTNAPRVSGANSFHDVDLLQELCPSLDSGPAPQLGAVRLYYKAVQLLGSTQWANGEMALCRSYAAAVLSQRMQRNQILAAEVCSF
jgi:hypothetical protein